LETGQSTTIRRLVDAWVPAGGDFMLPRAYAATITESADHPGLSITLVVDVDSFGRTSCRELTVRSVAGAPITPATLRSISLPDLLRVSARAATEKVKPGRGGGFVMAPMTAADLTAFYGQFAGARKPRQGSPITDEQLRQVAELHRGAAAQGLAPVKAIQTAMHVSRSTASRWVAAARSHGYLEKRSTE
jgi:hypothetical protein